MGSFVIPPFEVEFSFVRSSGPGGQNVNKVNSKAVLRWRPATTQALAPEARERVLNKLRDRLNQDGELVITSDRYRDQGRNREDCLQKLHEVVVQALYLPKKRKKSRPSYSSRLKAKKNKQLHSRKKALRRGAD